MRVHHLKTCDTCRKAIKALREAGHTPELVDVRADGIAADDLKRWIAANGDAVLNRRSTTWKSLDEQERDKAGSPEGMATLILAHPTLLKRPVIEADEMIHIGWTAATKAALTGG